MRLYVLLGATFAIAASTTGAQATASSDLVLCSNQPSKEERLACFEAAAKIASGSIRSLSERPKQERSASVSPAPISSRQHVVEAGADSLAKAPTAAIYVPPPFSWTGCYFGIHGGGGVMADSLTNENGGGAIAGGQVGCNYQIGQVVLGVEGEGAWSGLRDTSRNAFSIPGFGTQSTDNVVNSRWLADAAVRIGFAPVDHVLAYAKFGGAVSGFDMSSQIAAAGIFLPQAGSKQLLGLLWGAGSEFALGRGWSGKVEYNYINFLADDVFLPVTCSPAPCITQTRTVSSDQHLVKLGINYRWIGQQ